jgi:hypothetical protein
MLVDVRSRRRITNRSSAPVVALAVIIAVTALVTSACSIVETSAERSMHAHAANAATVLENQPATARATDAVRLVIGTGTDDTITVLAARGTMRTGVIELRIQVVIQPDAEFGQVSRATGCFDYTLDYVTHPDEVDCPDHGPMQLPPPSPVTTTTVS